MGNVEIVREEPCKYGDQSSRGEHEWLFYLAEAAAVEYRCEYCGARKLLVCGELVSYIKGDK